MMSPFNWPALSLEGHGLPESLDYERGVWGKAPGAASDYRWLAATPGFGAGVSNPARKLRLGTEDQPRKASLWLSSGRVCWAGVLYPSRARDAAGRRGFLEKQLACWRPGPGVPRVLGLLLLSPEVASWTDEVWWDGAAPRDWEQPDFLIRLDSSSAPPLEVTEDAVRMAIDAGLQAVRKRLGGTELTRLYAELQTSHGPAILGGLAEPLGALEMAVLLLPFDRRTADRLSVAGWVPSSRWRPEDLADSWDLVATDRRVDLKQTHSGSGGTGTAWRRAERMARTLLEDDLSVLGIQPPVGLQTGRPKTGPSVEQPGPTAESRGDPDLAVEVESLRKSNLMEDPGFADPDSSTGSQTPESDLSISSPPPDAPPLVGKVHAFARDPVRRWLTLEELVGDGGARPLRSSPRLTPREPGAELLWAWPREVDRQRPSTANPQQWAVKVACLWAAALALAPLSGLPTQMPTVDEPRVPRLLFAALLDRQDLHRLGPGILDTLSKEIDGRHVLPERARIVREWLERRR